MGKKSRDVTVSRISTRELTRDKVCSLIRKWHTLIEAFADVKTTDNYVVRLFVIGFTKKQQNQESANCYAQSSQIRAIRRKIIEIIHQEAGQVALRDLVKKLVPESIEREIETKTQG